MLTLSTFTRIDIAITQFFNQIAGHLPLFDTGIIFLTKAGVFLFVGALALRWWIKKSIRDQERHLIAFAGLSSACGLFINQIILLFIHRVRPYDIGISHLIIAPSNDPSFPSDHATIVFAIAFAFLLRKDWRAVPFLGIAILIALSRVYVGIHYFSDILGAAIVALIAALICSIIFTPNSKLNHLVTNIL